MIVQTLSRLSHIAANAQLPIRIEPGRDRLLAIVRIGDLPSIYIARDSFDLKGTRWPLPSDPQSAAGAIARTFRNVLTETADDPIRLSVQMTVNEISARRLDAPLDLPFYGGWSIYTAVTGEMSLRFDGRPIRELGYYFDPTFDPAFVAQIIREC